MPVVVVHQTQCVVCVFGGEAERVRFGDVERREGRVGGRGGHRAERRVLVVRRDASRLLEGDDVGDVLVPVVRVEHVVLPVLLEDERTRRNRLRRIPCNNETEGLPKSLTANGGQNPIEPAALGKPVLFGPNMQNFRSIVRSFLSNDAAIQIQNAEELEQQIVSLLSNPNLCQTLGHNAYNVVIKNQGGIKKSVEILSSTLKNK